MPPDTIDARALNRATLARQLLLQREAVPAVAVVERLAGMQAQDPGPPFVGLWTRIASFDPEELRGALATFEVVRATAMRGTLHLLSARDYRSLRSTLQDALLAGALGILRDRAARVDVDATLAAGRELVASRPRTQSELRSALQERFPDADDRALGLVARYGVAMVMRPAEHPWSFARDSSFTLAADAVGAEPDPAQRPEELVRRYLAAFGPASATDVRTWSGVAGIGETVQGLRDELVVLRHGRRELFDLPGAPRPGPDGEAPVRFLPEFDNLLLAHADRTRVIADEHRAHVFSRNLRVRSTFLVDGLVAGTWSVKRTRKVATLSLEPFGKLTKATVRALSDEGDGLARMLEPRAEDVAVAVEPAGG